MMPRFYFDTADGSRDRDTVGTILKDQAEARVEAIKFAGEVMTSQPDVLWDGHDFRVEVSSEDQKLLFTIIALAVDAPPPRTEAASKN